MHAYTYVHKWGTGGHPPPEPRSPTLIGKKFEIVTKKCNKIPNLGGGCNFEKAPTSSPWISTLKNVCAYIHRKSLLNDRKTLEKWKEKHFVKTYCTIICQTFLFFDRWPMRFFKSTTKACFFSSSNSLSLQLSHLFKLSDFLSHHCTLEQITKKFRAKKI